MPKTLKKNVLPKSYQTPGVYVQEVPSGVRPILGVSTTETVFLGSARRGSFSRAVQVLSFQHFERQYGNVCDNAELGCAVQQFFLNGGQRLWVVRTARDLTAARLAKAFRAVDAVKQFALLAFPGLTDKKMLERLVAYARQRGAFALLDAPAEARLPAQISQAVKKGDYPATPDAALYYPWLQIPDPQKAGRQRLCAPTGSAAGQIVRVDTQRGVWKFPAGLDTVLQGVSGLDYSVSAEEQEGLNPLGVNVIRALQVNRFVLWGARTLEESTGTQGEFRYISVRRTALFIRQSLEQGLTWTVFEPNAEPLWAQIRLNVGSFMNGLFRQGAFQGAAPAQAYFVRCDSSTMTSSDVQAGIVNLLVGFAPLKPAEFVALRITLKSA